MVEQILEMREAKSGKKNKKKRKVMDLNLENSDWVLFGGLSS